MELKIAAMLCALAMTFKPVGDHNPLSSNLFFADPTAVEYQGRLYVYGTCDQQEFDLRGGVGENSYSKINMLACYSTDDMVNWTWHGYIPVTKIAAWAKFSWAPSIVSREMPSGGTEFFLYFANSGGGIGVLRAESPLGPWEDPIGRPLISPDTNELAGDPVCWCFDPGVCIDENGTGWLAFGGGNPMSPEETAMLPGNCRIVRLGSDMVSLDSEIVTLPALYHFEANELNYINGTWALTYCTNWEKRTEWPEGLDVPRPSICSMVYMTSKDPLNPESWEYRGEYLSNPGHYGYPTSNNHSHLQKFGGRYYLLYQNVSLLENMELNASGYRSIGIDDCEVEEETVTIAPAKMTDAGVEQCKGFNVFRTNPAETAVTVAGIRYRSEGERIFAANEQDGSWIAVSGADFGDGAESFQASVRGNGILQIRIDAPDGEEIGELSFETGASAFETVTGKLEKTVNGIHDLYFIFAGNVAFDEWSFS